MRTKRSVPPPRSGSTEEIQLSQFEHSLQILLVGWPPSKWTAQPLGNRMPYYRRSYKSGVQRTKNAGSAGARPRLMPGLCWGEGPGKPFYQTVRRLATEYAGHSIRSDEAVKSTRDRKSTRLN